MVNITHKATTLRKAVAIATINVSSRQTIEAVEQRKVPKGDVFEFARAAGLLAIKKTSDAIPDCHPLPVEFAAITFQTENLSIIISVEVHTIYKTGVEVEAMHGAAITALVIYDMLKPIDKAVEIGRIRLEKKTGGKSDHSAQSNRELKCAVIVCSDSISKGINQDHSGKAIIAHLEKYKLKCDRYEIIPDDAAKIGLLAKGLANDGFDLLIFTGGTGISPTDVTPEALKALFTKELPGVSEVMRQYGQQRTPYSMLSRSVAGFINNTLAVALPGSKNAVEECMTAIFPHILHVFDVASGSRHGQ